MQYRFLIYISYSYALPIGIPIENEIANRGYTVKWFSDLTDGKKALSNKKNTLHHISDVLDYKPHIVLAATDDIPDFITGLKVQIFHGFFAEKRPKDNNKFTHFRIRGFFDLYCTQGPSTTIGFKEKTKENNFFEVIETGWSKVDPLFPLKERTSTKKTKTILIASTFSKRLSLALNNDVFEEIKRLSKKGDFQFLMVMHPKLPDDIKSKWKTLNGSHFTYFNTVDLIPLFIKADVLFADTTSAIQEFILQKKPVVTFNHTFKRNYLIDINSSKDIENAFNKALTYPELLMKNISNYIVLLHPYFDGKSSKRVVEATINALHKDKSYLKSKPLNLIRKYKIRKRLNFFTFKSYRKAYTVKL